MKLSKSTYSFLKKIASLCSMIPVMSCASRSANRGSMESYMAALNDATTKGAQQASGPAKSEGIKRFTSFYSHFSPTNVKNLLAEVYDTDAYFRDAAREVRGLPAMEEYFKSSVENVHSCRFVIDDVSEKGPHTYLRWVMHLQLEKDSPILNFVGMSHVILNNSGKVIFHQDYWDFSELLEHMPVIGGIIGTIKNRL